MTHPFIEAMVQKITASYREYSLDVLTSIGYDIPDTFTDDDVEDVLQRLRSASTSGVKCFYCDKPIKPTGAGRGDILAHSKVCPEHPCRALENEIEHLRRERDGARLSFCAATMTFLPDLATIEQAVEHHYGADVARELLEGPPPSTWLPSETPRQGEPALKGRDDR